MSDKRTSLNNPDIHGGGPLTLSGSASSLPVPAGPIRAGRAPMTSDSAHPAPGEPDKLKMPEDSSLGASSSGARAESAKGASSIDTIIGRLVVDQGLATLDEVEKILEHRKQKLDSKEPDSSDSLPLMLVKHDVITKRQLSRLKAMIEEERKGSQIPGYRVMGKLGAGAMATVFKGRQLSLDRLVAIKVLPRKYSQNAEFIARFYAEGKAAALLNHPNIVSAYDVGKAGEFHYFVMEYVDGTTVYDQIVKHRRFAEADAIDITIQIAEALKHAHERGLIHRDVKPKNIMFTTEGVVKLADMGLAREMSDKEAAENEAGKAYGTPYYISPEQIRGEMDITPSADIYSLGATLYHMVTGNVPFEGKSPSDVMHKHLKTPLAPPDHVNPKLSAAFSQIIEMMMAKAVKERYQTCRDLLTDLQALRRGEPLVIARHDASAVEMQTLAAAEESMIGEVPEDKSRTASVYSHPAFQLLVTFFVISFVVNIVVIWILIS